MQINGGQVTSAFSPKTFGLEDKARPPVVIDAPSTFNVSQSKSLVNTSAIVTPASNVQSQQQSRFVRTFATQSEPSTSTDEGLRKLPVGVQQYLQVSQLSSEVSQRLLDETV
ncbi:hypothetical protein A9Q79_04850 [Methylophaga sp. 42_25_T18]|nr:hypothetical protein A9Q79_04850 [Methylophaga sp. 42_25_T18]OUR85735.1 hypothetical protein A9Q92_07495 [Methylophaga sp. 42_8_T64]